MDRHWVLGCLKRAFQERKPEVINSDYVEKETMPKNIRKCVQVRFSSKDSA